MKNVFGAAALVCAFAAGSAFAGNIEDPVVEAPVVVEEATSSSSGAALVVLLTLVSIIPVLD